MTLVANSDFTPVNERSHAHQLFDFVTRVINRSLQATYPG